VRDADRDALLAEARLSVMGSELGRALDEAVRPSTAALRHSVAAGQLGKSVAFGAGPAAAAAADATPSGATSGAAPSLLPRPSTGGVRQSQDLFSALDLANTHAGLKQNFSDYWDQVEAQFKVEQAKLEEMREQCTRNAEQKHLQRLKAKMTAQWSEAAASSPEAVTAANAVLHSSPNSLRRTSAFGARPVASSGAAAHPAHAARAPSTATGAPVAAAAAWPVCSRGRVSNSTWLHCVWTRAGS